MVTRICILFLSATFVRRTVVSYEHISISASRTLRRTVGMSITVVKF